MELRTQPLPTSPWAENSNSLKVGFLVTSPHLETIYSRQLCYQSIDRCYHLEDLPDFRNSASGTGMCCACMLGCSVTSDRLQPFGLYPARILCPWTILGKNILLQRLFPAQALDPSLLCLLHCKWIPYLLSHWENPGMGLWQRPSTYWFIYYYTAEPVLDHAKGLHSTRDCDERAVLGIFFPSWSYSDSSSSDFLRQEVCFSQTPSLSTYQQLPFGTWRSCAAFYRDPVLWKLAWGQVRRRTNAGRWWGSGQTTPQYATLGNWLFWFEIAWEMASGWRMWKRWLAWGTTCRRWFRHLLVQETETFTS